MLDRLMYNHPALLSPSCCAGYVNCILHNGEETDVNLEKREIRWSGNNHSVLGDPKEIPREPTCSFYFMQLFSPKLILVCVFPGNTRFMHPSALQSLSCTRLLANWNTHL